MQTKTITVVPVPMVKPIASAIAKRLEEHCLHVEIAGNIRRNRDTTRGIRIVCVPRLEKKSVNLFDERLTRCQGFLDYVGSMQIIEGDPATSQRIKIFVQCESLPTPDNLFPLYIDVASTSNLGYVLSEATGPADYNARLRRGLHRKGFIIRDNLVVDIKSGFAIPIPTEKDYARVAGERVLAHPNDRY